MNDCNKRDDVCCLPLEDASDGSIVPKRTTMQNGNMNRSVDETTGKIDEYHNGTVQQQQSPPPDGGSRAWFVMIGSFFCNGILFGVINSYSIIYTEIYDSLQMKNVTDAGSKAALVGSLTIGTTFFVSPVSGVLTDAIGLQRTTFLGGALASLGMLTSSFFADNVQVLYFTYGAMYGIGGALAYTPSLAILGHYFQRYLGVVNGIVTAGSSTFTMLLSYVLAYFLKSYGLVWTLRLIALLACGIMGCAVLFKPANDLIRREQKAKRRRANSNLIEAFNVSIWRNKRYLVWALVIPIALFGYFVPYVHMLKFVEDNYSDEYDGKLPVICIGVTSGVGRLIFGYIADMPNVNRIFLQQISFLGIGILTLLLPTAKGNFYWLICISLLMGLFDGCFISLLGPIAFDICGQDGATQAIGFLLGLCSFPLTIGPYIAGKMYDSTHDYDLAFRLAGLPPIVGAFAMCAIRFVKDEDGCGTRKDKLMTGSKSNGDVALSETIDGEARLASAETLEADDNAED